MGGLCEGRRGGNWRLAGPPPAPPAEPSSRPLPPPASSSQSASAAMAGAPTLALLLLGQLLAATVTLTEAQVSVGPWARRARL